MIKRGKKHEKALGVLGSIKQCDIREGVGKVKDLAYARFDESISVNVVLGIDPEKAEHGVRGSLVLPHVFGKKIKILAFCKGDQAELALKSGADYVGAEDLIEKILSGWIDFDYAVATPDLMGLVGKAAKILGPKGLLPSKKNNTVALDLSSIIKELKSGLLFFKNDKNGQINFRFGKKSLSVEGLEENLRVFFRVLKTLRPASLKGNLIKKATISSTMGVGVALDVSEFNK
jgi:large subunit ribosomal protein L1